RAIGGALLSAGKPHVHIRDAPEVSQIAPGEHLDTGAADRPQYLLTSGKPGFRLVARADHHDDEAVAEADRAARFTDLEALHRFPKVGRQFTDPEPSHIDGLSGADLGPERLHVVAAGDRFADRPGEVGLRLHFLLGRV